MVRPPPPPPPDGLTVNFLIICALSVNFVSRLNRKIRVKMHSNLSFWGQKNDFSGEGLRPLLTEILNTPLTEAIAFHNYDDRHINAISK